MTAQGPFFQVGASCPAYEVIRDHPGRAETRAWIERLWDRYRHVCRDKKFRHAAKQHFRQRVWEMFVAGVIDESGGQLVPSGGDGPDLHALGHCDANIWIEAVSPDEADSSASHGMWMEGGRGGFLDEDPMLLRYTNALRTKAAVNRKDGKRSQYEKFVERGIVDPRDPFVVALDGSGIRDADIASDLPPPAPLILKALFPFGTPTWTVTPYEQVTGPEYPYRPEIERDGKVPVATTLFAGQDYAHVSAVIYCATAGQHARDLLGRTFHIIHNPNARVPVRHGTFRFGIEWFGDPGTQEGLRWTDWRRWPHRPKWRAMDRFRLRRAVRLWRSRRPRANRGWLLHGGSTLLVRGRPMGRWVPVLAIDPDRDGALSQEGWIPKKYLDGPLSE